MFSHCNIHKYTWKSPDWKTYNQIDNILADIGNGIQVYLMSDRSFRAADFDADHYLVVAKIWERIAVNKQGLHNFIWRGSSQEVK
jgi:hypothetical protein